LLADLALPADLAEPIDRTEDGAVLVDFRPWGVLAVDLGVHRLLADFGVRDLDLPRLPRVGVEPPMAKAARMLETWTLTGLAGQRIP
jgi:hypothetical protein